VVYVTYKSRVGHQLTDTWSNTGVWLTVTFTVERYICVCFPIKAIVWCTPRRARHIIVAVCISAALLTAPEFFATTTAQVLTRQRILNYNYELQPQFLEILTDLVATQVLLQSRRGCVNIIVRIMNV